MISRQEVEEAMCERHHEGATDYWGCDPEQDWDFYQEVLAAQLGVEGDPCDC